MKKFVQNFVDALRGAITAGEHNNLIFDLPLNKFYDYIFAVKYKKQINEKIQSIEKILTQGGDCGDFTFLFALWCFKQNIPFLLCFGSDNDFKASHVWLKALIDGKPVNLDATRKDLKQGDKLKFTDETEIEFFVETPAAAPKKLRRVI